ncbi:MAG: glucose-6-phosphate isomerase [Azoarcus sp.]|jgi:glucose-6-phosphate isomerase|nr:glucose-6-phosphate isomerase [Azoarcus sp.]
MSDRVDFTPPQLLPAWAALSAHAARLARQPLSSLFANNPDRAHQLTLIFENPAELDQTALISDFSKQQLDEDVIKDLIRLAREANLGESIYRFFNGAQLNFTEKRAASHMSMRGGCPPPPGNGADTHAMRTFAFDLREGLLIGSTGKTIRHLVNLGIGGSDLGPRLAVEALGSSSDHFVCGIELPQVDFVANVDPLELNTVLAHADAAGTLFVVSSKSFSTPETLANAEAARQWLRSQLGNDADISAHFAAVSNASETAVAFGIRPDRVFPLPDWVGGRYSVWSAIGLPLLVAVGGMFDDFLAGGRIMDDHFRLTPFEQNLPVWLGLTGLWNSSFLNIQSVAALPYAHGLRSFPGWLQQLEMESNGKHTLRDGSHTEADTAPVVWGSAGTIGQHAFHQLLYQGTRRVALDFIIPVGDAGDPRQRILVDNAIAQAAALMAGRDLDAANASLSRHALPAAEIKRLAPHLVSKGNQPSTTIMLPRLDAFHLGALLALYEHKVFVQGWIWGINPFDQYGVEHGKEIARALASGKTNEQDASTAQLVRLAEEFRQKMR